MDSNTNGRADGRRTDNMYIISSYDDSECPNNMKDEVQKITNDNDMVVPKATEFISDSKDVSVIEMKLAPEFMDFGTLMNVYRELSSINGFREMFISLESININRVIKERL